MLVSNFALGYNYAFSASDRVWTASYELQITNLDTTPINFGVEARVTYSYFGGSSGHESETALLYQMLRRDFHKDADGYYCYDEMLIEPQSARKWNIGPWAFEGRRWTPYVDGYVTMRVPVTPGRGADDPDTPQSTKPVPVLLNCRRRDEWWSSFESAPFQQQQVSESEGNPQLATGTAYNEIEPDTKRHVRPFGIGQYQDLIVKGFALNAPSNSGMVVPVVALKDQHTLDRSAPVRTQDDSRAAQLVSLLLDLEADDAELATLNEILRTRKAGISITKDGKGKRAAST